VIEVTATVAAGPAEFNDRNRRPCCPWPRDPVTWSGGTSSRRPVRPTTDLGNSMNQPTPLATARNNHEHSRYARWGWGGDSRIGRNHLSPISRRYRPPLEFIGDIERVAVHVDPPDTNAPKPLDD